MANRDDLTNDEWEYLQRTLEAATDAVMVAHPGGTLREGIAVIQGWAEAPRMFPGDAFVLELFQATPNELRQLNDEKNDNPDRGAEEIIADAVEMCRRSVALLREKDPEDCEIYRRVILFLAEKVARAAKEGGFFGIGGKRISDAESAVIQRITAALESED